MSLLLRRHINLSYSAFEPETLTAIARMSVAPSFADIINYDQWIKEIKAGHNLQWGVASLGNIFRLLILNAAHDAQAATVNFARPTNDFDGTVVSGPLGFTAYRGTWSTGSPNYMRFPLAMLLDAYRTYGAMGAYHYNDSVVGAWGSGLSNGNWNAVIQRASTNFLGRINSTSTATSSTLALGNPGLFSLTRQVGQQRVWRNSTILGTQNGSADLGGFEATVYFGVHALVRNGDIVGYSTEVKSMHYYGSFDINPGVVKTATENYLAKYP